MEKAAAIVVRRFGGPQVLEATELELNGPGPGRVRIAVELASVTFVETQLRAGRAPRPEMLPELPWVPGNGVAGTVAELGEGVDPALLGTRVVSTTGGSGGYAARAEVAATDPIPVPAGLELEAAAALLADGRTAGKLELAAELGAAETVDYSAAGWSEAIAPLDVVFDGVGGELGADASALPASPARRSRRRPPRDRGEGDDRQDAVGALSRLAPFAPVGCKRRQRPRVTLR